ncbi:hypothetical protein [Methylocystis parvus]|uniref:Uncharacterized protein n=1 Tax=Methylocystis parvus TaxID=134 RepID=A0A6B8M505_9HYPH|nr:hypothetical protein [Methylocystis parvus]QGN00078.1 hypothetical protein F7D14_21075 [Methylocystis parvus]WBK02426.1 hypothetical protein MMG94_21570 [Methylocystis parvus OBBP]
MTGAIAKKASNDARAQPMIVALRPSVATKFSSVRRYSTHLAFQSESAFSNMDRSYQFAAEQAPSCEAPVRRPH